MTMQTSVRGRIVNLSREILVSYKKEGKKEKLKKQKILPLKTLNNKCRVNNSLK